MSIIFVLGGARSGKSSYAEKTAASLSENVAYIATGQAFDAEMQKRIAIHQAQRTKNWSTYEEPQKVTEVISKNKTKHDVFLVDCLTLLISNILLNNQNIDKISFEQIMQKEDTVRNEINQLITEAKINSIDLIIVSNEIGLGLVPDNALSRAYRDIVGRANQLIATKADKVVVVWAGIPLQIKPELGRILDE